MNRLKELRADKGLYQKDLAKIFNVAVSTYSYWEQGKFEPDSETLRKLADFFGVSVDYLLERDSVGDTELSPKGKELIEVISAFTDSELDEMKNYLDFILAKRKKTEDS